jgi:hypothetical protein
LLCFIYVNKAFFTNFSKILYADRVFHRDKDKGFFQSCPSSVWYELKS